MSMKDEVLSMKSDKTLQSDIDYYPHCIADLSTTADN